jgi:hypothetical protein
VSTVRPRHGILLAVICLTIVAALMLATVGAGASGLGLSELVSGPRPPAGAAQAPATAAQPISVRRAGG